MTSLQSLTKPGLNAAGVTSTGEIYGTPMQRGLNRRVGVPCGNPRNSKLTQGEAGSAQDRSRVSALADGELLLDERPLDHIITGLADVR